MTSATSSKDWGIRMRNTDKDWTRIAEEAPYWGVLSADEFKGVEIDRAAHERFFASGETQISSLFTEIDALSPSFCPKRSLDFGCGVGRVLLPIAARSLQAVGVDIAPNMLALTKRNAEATGVSNIDLLLSDDTLSLVTGKFDFVHSFIVLQHIPPERGYQIIRQLLSLLEPAGVFALHVGFAKARELMVHEMPAARYYRRDGTILHDLCIQPPPPEGTVQMFDYDLNQVFAIVSEFPVARMSVKTVADSHLAISLLGKFEA
jgi:SAM-dependent methyltransferase